MVQEATGAQGIALTKLVQLIAGSTTFQRVRNVTSSYDAEEHIHYPWLETPIDEVENSRPAAIIEQGDYEWSVQAGGDQNYLLPGGSLKLTLTDNERVPGDYRSSAVEFLNFCDGVIQDIVEMAAQDDQLAIQGIQQTRVPMRSHPTNEPAQIGYWSAEYEILWGVGGE